MTHAKRPILISPLPGAKEDLSPKPYEGGWPVRALVLDAADAAPLALRNAGVEVVQGSFEDTDVIRVAMKDTYGVFSVLPANLTAEDEIRYGISIADLAAEIGVDHLVYSSGASVGDELTAVARLDAKLASKRTFENSHHDYRPADDLHGDARATWFRFG
jgi:uncharacterized protein YbjT (DUF2867 family)